MRSSLGLGCEWSVGRLAIDFLKAALRPGALRGAACPDVLKGSGARVGLPVAHYSDRSQRLLPPGKKRAAPEDWEEKAPKRGKMP